jgi:hypothetical protein
MRSNPTTPCLQSALGRPYESVRGELRAAWMGLACAGDPIGLAPRGLPDAERHHSAPPRRSAETAAGLSSVRSASGMPSAFASRTCTSPPALRHSAPRRGEECACCSPSSVGDPGLSRRRGPAARRGLRWLHSTPAANAVPSHRQRPHREQIRKEKSVQARPLECNHADWEGWL